MNITEIMKENNINLISVLEQFTDSPESKLLEALLEALSEFYSENHLYIFDRKSQTLRKLF